MCGLQKHWEKLIHIQIHQMLICLLNVFPTRFSCWLLYHKSDCLNLFLSTVAVPWTSSSHRLATHLKSWTPVVPWPLILVQLNTLQLYMPFIFMEASVPLTPNFFLSQFIRHLLALLTILLTLYLMISLGTKNWSMLCSRPAGWGYSSLNTFKPPCQVLTIQPKWG